MRQKEGKSVSGPELRYDLPFRMRVLWQRINARPRDQ